MYSKRKEKLVCKWVKQNIYYSFKKMVCKWVMILKRGKLDGMIENFWEK